MTRRITSTPFLPGECSRPSNQVILRVYLYPFIKATQTPPSLSGIGSKTMVTPTGKATTTVVNKTTAPFNQTMVTSGSNQSQQHQHPLHLPVILAEEDKLINHKSKAVVIR